MFNEIDNANQSSIQNGDIVSAIQNPITRLKFQLMHKYLPCCTNSIGNWIKATILFSLVLIKSITDPLTIHNFFITKRNNVFFDSFLFIDIWTNFHNIGFGALFDFFWILDVVKVILCVNIIWWIIPNLISCKSKAKLEYEVESTSDM